MRYLSGTSISGVRVTWFLVGFLLVVLWIFVCLFVLFLLAILFSVLLRILITPLVSSNISNSKHMLDMCGGFFVRLVARKHFPSLSIIPLYLTAISQVHRPSPIATFYLHGLCFFCRYLLVMNICIIDA